MMNDLKMLQNGVNALLKELEIADEKTQWLERQVEEARKLLTAFVSPATTLQVCPFCPDWRWPAVADAAPKHSEVCTLSAWLLRNTPQLAQGRTRSLE